MEGGILELEQQPVGVVVVIIIIRGRRMRAMAVGVMASAEDPPIPITQLGIAKCPSQRVLGLTTMTLALRIPGCETLGR